MDSVLELVVGISCAVILICGIAAGYITIRDARAQTFEESCRASACSRPTCPSCGNSMHKETRCGEWIWKCDMYDCRHALPRESSSENDACSRSPWARRFKRHCPTAYKEALRRAGEPVVVYETDETGERQWVVALEDDFLDGWVSNQRRSGGTG